MREKLNSNPMAQLAVIGVLLLAGALLMMRTMGGGSEEASTSSTAPATPSATAATGAVADPAATTTAPTAATAPVTGAIAAASAAPVVPDPPPLPDEVVAAHDSGATVAVLLVHPSAAEDRLVEEAVRGLAEPGLAVFVAPAREIANYASITQGVNLDRVPALIVIKPKSAGDAAQPEAIVRYGFRNPESVVQAVKDAAYQGPTETYSPE